MSDFYLTDEITSLLEASCNELKPVEPFPFKSNRISRGVRFQHYLILFPFYPEYKKLKHLYTFNLFNRKWGNVELRNSPEILENTDNYKVVSGKENEFVLFGCYKAFQANTTGNLFFQSQAMTLKKTLGWISAEIDQGELTLKWKECEGADQLPYREKFSAYLVQDIGLPTLISSERDCLEIFGGCDENGVVMNDLFQFNFKEKTGMKIKLHPAQWGGNDNLPCARMSHGAANRSWTLIFGGEDQHSNVLNDIWRFGSDFLCNKYSKKPINRCPKLGTPSSWYGKYRRVLLYIAKSTTQTLPPFKNYLCAEIFETVRYESLAWSQKEPLPFDGVPHTMEIFENQLIFGFESSIYSITFEDGIAPNPDFENYEKTEDFDEGVLTKKKTRPMNFKSHMRQYFEEKPFPDVTFKVQGEEISAHRGILSVRCSFFGELFGAESGREEKNKPVEITDLSLTGFNALLEWLYCNEILDFKDEVAIELLKVTNRYSLSKLKIEAETCLMNNLTAENILERAKLAVEYNARELETVVVKFIVKEMDEVKKKEELKNFPDSIQERVCNMEKMNDNSFAAKLYSIK